MGMASDGGCQLEQMNSLGHCEFSPAKKNLVRRVNCLWTHVLKFLEAVIQSKTKKWPNINGEMEGVTEIMKSKVHGARKV